MGTGWGDGEFPNIVKQLQKEQRKGERTKEERARGRRGVWGMGFGLPGVDQERFVEKRELGRRQKVSSTSIHMFVEEKN